MVLLPVLLVIRYCRRLKLTALVNMQRKRLSVCRSGNRLACGWWFSYGMATGYVLVSSLLVEENLGVVLHGRSY